MIELNGDVWHRSGVRMFVKRDDLIDPLISGNKWRKLKYNLAEAKRQGQDTLLSFGGAYSNHIHALAHAGRRHGFRTIGVIRGHWHRGLNATLRDAEACGMELFFVSADEYRQRQQPEFQRQLHRRFGDFYLLPEGGSNALATRGCRELVDELEQQLEEGFDVVAVACGTGATLAGLAQGLRPGQRAVGVAVLKNAAFLHDQITRLKASWDGGDWSLILDGHRGGYARFDPELLEYVRDFRQRFDVPLEPIYTGKLFFQLERMVRRRCFAPGSRIVAVHTGGLQGLAGLREKGLIDF